MPRRKIEAQTEVQRAVQRLVDRHGGLRKAARATGLSAPYLSRLRNGIVENPGKDVQDILGVRRTTSYETVGGKSS